MVPERLWAAFRFVPWEDTVRFHVRLFRCFLLGFLDAHGELAFLSQLGPERIWTVLGRRLADVGLVHDAGRLNLHEPGSHRARCPPKSRYEATWLLSFSAMGQTVPVPPFVPQPMNITRGLHDEPRRSAAAFDIPGSGRVLGGYDGLVTVGCILLLLFTLAVSVSRSSSVARARSDSTRTVCRLPTVAVDATTNSSKRLILSTDEAAQGLITDTPEDVDQTSMPGAWLLGHREQKTLEILDESVMDTIPWTLFRSCARMGIKAWAHISGWTGIITAPDLLNRGSNDVVTVERKSDDGRFPVCQGLGLNAFDFDAGVSTTAVPNETGQLGVAPNRLSSECRPSPGNLRESNTVMHNRRCGPPAVGGVAIRDQEPAQMTTLDVSCGDKMLTLPLVASSNPNRGSYQEDMSLDGDASTGEDGPDEGLFCISSRSPLERKDAYRVLGRQQDGALSDTGYPFSLRRARSAGYLQKKHDVFDDDEQGTGDDFYWTEQVNARLSGERDLRLAPDWSDGCSRPREGQEDESDNWRTRGSQIVAAREETSDAVQCQLDSNSIKLRRYSSPPLNVNASLSDRTGSGDGPPGIYVVPQKRGRRWSPASSPRPSGLGFFPFRKTPSLLTPEAWRPGCLYLSDPPVDESGDADAWWDSLTRGTGTLQEQGPPCSREGPVSGSWRDRYENDPASRRFIPVHRRARTDG